MAGMSAAVWAFSMEIAKRLQRECQMDQKFQKKFKIRMRVEALFKKVSKPLQTSLSKSASEGHFCRDVCNGLDIFCENGKTAAEGGLNRIKNFKNFKIRVRGEAILSAKTRK